MGSSFEEKYSKLLEISNSSLESRNDMAKEGAFKEMTGTLAGMTPEERINAILSLGEPDSEGKRITSQFLEDRIAGCKLKSFERVTETTARATYSFKVTRFYCNGSGNLHGGAQATMYDLCTSLTLQAIGRPGFWINGGVSRVLTVNYLRPAPEGTELEMETEVTAIGKSLAMLRAVLKIAKDGKIVSTCEHNKAAVASKPNWKL
jgi:acyl-coenzyme A thioesterase 13